MDKNNFLKKVFTKKNQDYTFTVLFLLIFSAFIILAINPSLRTAFSLNKEEKDLKAVDDAYEQKITSIATIQSQIEENRDNLPLLNQAVSQFPEVNKMVDDVKTAADTNNFFIKKANIADVNLSKSKKEIDSVKLSVEGETDFKSLMSFISELFSQRRLKEINGMRISQSKESTASGKLNVILIIEGFYL